MNEAKPAARDEASRVESSRVELFVKIGQSEIKHVRLKTRLNSNREAVTDSPIETERSRGKRVQLFERPMFFWPSL